MTDTNPDPRDADVVPAPPIDDAPSTTGIAVPDDDEPVSPPADQQSALEEAVERGEPEGSAAAGA